MTDNRLVTDRPIKESVVTLDESDEVGDAKQKMLDTGHDGFPVCSDGKLVGYLTSREILFRDDSDNVVSDIMITDYPVFCENIGVDMAKRIMFRYGRSEVPVVEQNGTLIGIITNTDIIRSEIERTTPSKVDSLKKTLHQIHNETKINVENDSVEVESLIPTQEKIFSDELEGREYELDNGLAEPIVVVRSGTKSCIADGHHRAVAAYQLGIDKLNAYVLEVPEHVEVGLIEQAIQNGLTDLEDVTILSDRSHPDDRLFDTISEINF